MKYLVVLSCALFFSSCDYIYITSDVKEQKPIEEPINAIQVVKDTSMEFINIETEVQLPRQKITNQEHVLRVEKLKISNDD